MRVADILKAKGSTVVVSTHASDPITTAIQKLHQNRIGALVVLDDRSQVLGILSERDIVRCLAEHGANALSQRVEQMMTKPIYVCKPTDDVKEVMSWMTHYRVRHLPVVDQDQLRGMISIGDVVKHRLTEVQTEANVLRDIIIASH